MAPSALQQAPPPPVQAPQAPQPAAPVNLGPDVQEYLNQADLHLSEAHRHQMNRANDKEPSPQHHKTGVGIYLAALALSALDPTHKAGEGFLSGFRSAKESRETEANQSKALHWLHGQQREDAAAKAEQSMATALLKQGEQAQTERDKRASEVDREQTNRDRMDETNRHNTTVEDLIRQRDESGRKLKEADSAHRRESARWNYVKSALHELGSDNPDSRKEAALVGVHLTQQMLKDPDLTDDDRADLQAMLGVFHHAHDNPSVKQTVQGAKNAALKVKQKADIAKQALAEARSKDLHASIQSQIAERHEKLREAGIKFPKEMERLDAAIAHLRKSTDQMGGQALTGMTAKQTNTLYGRYKDTVTDLHRQLEDARKDLAGSYANNIQNRPENPEQRKKAESQIKLIKATLEWYDEHIGKLRESLGVKRPSNDELMGGKGKGMQTTDVPAVKGWGGFHSAEDVNREAASSERNLSQGKRPAAKGNIGKAARDARKAIKDGAPASEVRKRFRAKYGVDLPATP